MDLAIKEGFLCPMCFQDLQSFHNLQHHFETSHSNEDKAVMGQIKGLFTKAKDKFWGKDDEDNDPTNPFNSISAPEVANQSFQSYMDPALWEPQELGVTKSWMDKFKDIRDARIDRVVIETNKILIRLEKLTKQIKIHGKPNDKDFEKSLVPWVLDEDVPFCPTCGDRFTVARRKHHCRLCGAIMCTKCSLFLPFQVAEELLKSVSRSTRSSPIKTIRRNVQPQDPSTEESENICVRICFECDKVLQRNKEKLDRKHNPTLLMKLYEKMQKAMTDAIKLAPEFQKMADSLNNGEEEFKLDIATQKRFQLMQMFEAIDVLSKKISALDAGNEEEPPTAGTVRLQSAIRQSAYTFLQENMLSLPSLPSQPKLQILQLKRRTENERRLREQRIEAQRLRDEEKRRQEVERLRQERDAIEQSRREQMSAVATEVNVMERPSMLGLKDQGWSADTISISSKRSSRRRSYTSSSDDEDDYKSASTVAAIRDDRLDPLLEQIQYVQESAKQARGAGMIQEAESLERNMEELKQEYKRQRTARAFAMTPSSPVDDYPQNFESPAQGFTPSMKILDDTGEDPLLQQIKYISKCIDEARAANKLDEARILSENLEELKLIVKQSQKFT